MNQKIKLVKTKEHLNQDLLEQKKLNPEEETKILTRRD